MRNPSDAPYTAAPRVIDGRLLVDGGISICLPVNVVRRMGADVIIAVDISTPPLQRDELHSALDITHQIINFLTNRNTAQQIASLTDRMAQISAQLKVFARKTSGRSVPVSVSAAVEAALGILTTRTRALGAEVRCNLPAGDLMVRGDTVRLEQVLVNLVNNALQAMEGNEQPRLEITAETHDGRVDLVIRDNGPGILEALVAQVFDPFFTTKETGLGLGLSISKRITEEMGGALHAGRATGGGAEFTLELLRAESADRESALG